MGLLSWIKNLKTNIEINDLLMRIGILSNSVNALENQVLVLQQENRTLKENVKYANDTILDLHEPLTHKASQNRKPIVNMKYNINDVYKEMEESAPGAFKIYMDLMKVNEECYIGEPTHSCASAGDIGSMRFSKFISRYIHGNVLDVGCGPVEMPLYLKDYPTEKIYGLDPLLPHKEHPFEFVQGVAEKIPWNDEAFDVVIFATSFDHLFLVDCVMNEVCRVLKEDGYLLIWIGFDNNAKEYNPYAKDFKPYDKYHMFHYSKNNYEKLMMEKFDIIEIFKNKENANSFFYAMKKRPRAV